MEYSSGKVGRVFAARFYEGEPVYAGIEEIARREKVRSAFVLALGGVKRGKVVQGPRKLTGPLEAMVAEFDDAREIVAVGTLHWSTGKGKRPLLHLHGGIGRGGKTPIIGCPRVALDTFMVLEVIIVEIKGLAATRELDPATGLKLLHLAGAKEVRLVHS